MASPGAPALPVLAAVMAAGIASAHPAGAQDISLNYESLSSLEEPIATEIGDVTIVMTGLLDASLIRDTGTDDDTGAGSHRQLPGRRADPVAEPLAGRADLLRAVCRRRAFRSRTGRQVFGQRGDLARRNVGNRAGRRHLGHRSRTDPPLARRGQRLARLRRCARRARGSGRWLHGPLWTMGRRHGGGRGRQLRCRRDVAASGRRQGLPPDAADWPGRPTPPPAARVGSTRAPARSSRRSSTAARRSTPAWATSVFRRAVRTRTDGMSRRVCAGRRAW